MNLGNLFKDFHLEQYFGQFSSSAIGDGSTVTKVLVLKG